MASYFGEVLCLDSRAVDDDDCIESKMKKPELIMDLHDEVRESPAVVLVCAIGRFAIAFVNSYFGSSDKKLVGSARVKMPELEDNQSGLVHPKEPKTVAKFYLARSSANSSLICEVDDDITDELGFSFSQIIVNIPSNSSTECIIFSSSHLSSYRSANERVQDPFVRCLFTSSACQDVLLPDDIVFLEPPNIVANLAAALLSDFQVAGRSAVLFICFADTADLNSEVIQLFEKVYKFPFVNVNLIKDRDSFARLQNYCVQNTKQPDNLYT